MHVQCIIIHAITYTATMYVLTCIHVCTIRTYCLQQRKKTWLLNTPRLQRLHDKETQFWLQCSGRTKPKHTNKLHTQTNYTHKQNTHKQTTHTNKLHQMEIGILECDSRRVEHRTPTPPTTRCTTLHTHPLITQGE